MASAVIGALRVNLGINTAQFKEGLDDLAKNLGNVGKRMQKIGTGMSAAVTAPLAGFAAMTVKTAGNFEASMNRVEAATGATAEEIKAMRDMAVQLGADTSFSASESADAMEMLAKNGLAASQILDGAVAASMDLAAASGSDLSSAADVATDVMMNFGKEAKELGGLVDGITGVLLQSKFGFDDYRLAIGQAGGVAGNLGVTFQDFNAVIAATSSAFASGSDAGTSFKNFLTRLVPASDAAAARIEELGLSFFAADGSMKSMSAIAGELQAKMAGLSDEQLNAAMKDIFGVDAMRTGIMLMKQGAEGIDAMRAKISEASAEEQAAARLKGFNGELEKLSGAFETLQIAIADSGLLAMVTSFVSKVAEWVDALASANPQLLRMGVIVGGLAAALGPIVLTLGTLAVGIAAVGAPVAAVVASIAALTAGLIAFAPQINAAQAAIEGWVSSGWDVLKNAINAAQTAIENLATSGVQSIANLVNGVQTWIENKLFGIFDGIRAKVNAVKDTFYNLYDAVVGHSFIPDMVTGIGQWMAKLGGLMVQPANEAVNQVSGSMSSLGDVGEGVGQAIGSAFRGVLDGSKSVKEALSDLLKQLSDMMMNQAFQMIFGGGSFGGGGLIGSIFKSIFPGFANGGSFQVGGAGGIDSQLVAFRASPNETVSITKPGQDNGGGVAEVDVRGVFVDDNGVIKAQVTSMGQQATQAGAALATRQVQQSFPSMMANAQVRAT